MNDILYDLLAGGRGNRLIHNVKIQTAKNRLKFVIGVWTLGFFLMPHVKINIPNANAIRWYQTERIRQGIITLRN